MLSSLPEHIVNGLSGIVSPLAVLGAIAVVSVFAVYFCVYLWAEVTRGSTIRFVKPIRASKPESLTLYLLFPVAAFVSGILRTLRGVHSLYVEVVKTKTPDDIKSVPSGARFRTRGEVTPKDSVEGPITGNTGAIIFWTIDGWTGTRWKRCESELQTGKFEIHGGTRFDEPVVVLPDNETEYSLDSGTQEIVKVEKNEPVPERLRKFLQEHAPFAPDTIRFREVRIEEGQPLSVFGEMTEQNIDGRWERVVDHPGDDGVRVVVTTEDVPRLVKEVWRDASTGLMWGLSLFAYGCLALAGLAEILATVIGVLF